MTETQFQILDVLYFAESFDSIVEETGLPRSLVKEELKELISKGWVCALKYDEGARDWTPSAFYDLEQDFKYMATREGLMRHAGR
ncbi:MAG: helix-turn-helix domain-containing protein [Bacteroidia bacterium]|nr:MarR family transcriptional regulator [Bacteroidia bacterium]MDW8332980.1 helix-turn-helix domain-containing protein [Bacteroidia bacterium]